ncbi:MAG TPA: sigma-54 dependent transcriptional regulator [Pirellulaceae bacterium]|nr:sigma-54 dependent transcriptional regulator [Pirellulaceae bacterium]
MTAKTLVLSRNQKLLLELGQQFEGQRMIVPCDTLQSLHERLKSSPAGAVLVHMDRLTLDGHSPGRFLAELGEAIEEAPLFALLDEDCPLRLRKLAEKAADESFEFPLDYGRLCRLLAPQQDLEGELAGFWSEMPHKELHGQSRSLVTFTPEMFETMDEIKVAARHNVTVLLIGETGCGKTFLARLIHELSDRRDDRFCTVACGALPPDLIESELFGNVKGAFTGADRDREGKFAAAGSGTLLLDEIDVLPLEQQAKLLRVIETGEYDPVGSNETQYSQARLIVASNYDLEELVRAGSFRTDLYYRLNILNFHLLPLRQRPWDIEYLARKFALEHSRTHGIQLRLIEPDFFEALRRYQWPGNVREMENIIRRAVLYCQRGVLSVNDLPSSLRAAAAAGAPASLLARTPLSDSRVAEDAARVALPVGIAGRLHPIASTARPLAPHIPLGTQIAAAADYFHPLRSSSSRDSLSGEQVASAAMGGPLRTATATLEARVDVLERRIIEDCLQRNNFRRKETAAELGISRVTLYNKMKKFGLL